MAAKTCVMFLKPCLLPSEAPGTLSHRRDQSSEPGARERSRETCLICSARLLVIGGQMATHAERETNDFRSTVGQPRHASEHTPAFFARWFMSTKIGRSHVSTPLTNAHLVCRPLLEKNTATLTTYSKLHTHT